MTEEKKRLILEPDDYNEDFGFLELNGSIRIELLEIAPPVEFRSKCADMDDMNVIKGLRNAIPICSFETCLRWNICKYHPK